MSDKAIFLDRDDTIIEDPGYISDPEQVKLIDGVASALADFRRMGYRLIVVSNQSAVARGIVTERKLDNIHDRMMRLLAERGAVLDGIYYCPYHPDGAIPKYRKDSENRKPAPGMLLTAASEMDIELTESWMIGNSPRDIEAGFRAGCRTILVELPSRQRRTGGFARAPDYRAINLKEAVNIVKKYAHVARKPESEAQQTEPNEVNSSMSLNETGAKNSSHGAERSSAGILGSQAGAFSSAQEESLTSSTATHAEPDPGRALQPARESRQVSEPEPAPAYTQHRDQKVVDQAESGSIECGSEQAGEPAAQHQQPDEDLPLTILDMEEQQTGIEDLLTAILDELRSMQRKDLYGEFSVMRLMAGIVQVLVLFCLVITVWFLMSPKSQDGAVLLSLGFAAVLQLMALTFYTMHGRK